MTNLAKRAETKISTKSAMGPEVIWAWNKAPDSSTSRYKFYTLFDDFEKRWGNPPPKSLWDELWKRSVE